MSIIINSRSCSNAGFWAKHLQKVEGNERVEIIGFYGLSAETIEGALSEMRGMARASRNCKNYFSQYNINPRADYRLTEAQWEEAHKLHLQNHGLDHLPYFRVRHIKDGREHEHGIVLRVDPETGKAISDSLTAAINERTSRALEIRFGLERGESVLTPDREQERPDRRPKKHENFRTERSGIDPETVKADARAARQRADNGQSFRAALEESGAYVLARGDRRDFVIIDRGGGDHSLARRLGMKAAELRAYMADLDPAGLPGVAEAKAQQQARAAAERRQSETEGMDDDIAVKQRQQRQEIEDREAARYNDMVAERNRADRFILEWQNNHEIGARNKRHLQEVQWRREAEGDITDVRDRALIAAGESRDFVQAVLREGAMITEEHAALQREIALEKDPDKKHLLELRRDIQHADYMALANERVAAMSNLGGEQYKEAMRQQEIWANIGTDLRKERLELQERMADQEMRKISQAVEQADAAKQQKDELRADTRGSQPGAQAAPEVRPFSPTVNSDRPALAVLRDEWEAERKEQPETPREAAQTLAARAGGIAPATAETRAGEPDRPAEIIYSSPSVPERNRQPSTRENTDARAESSTAEHAEMTDSKAAKKAALAQLRAETEQAIQQGHGRGHGYSR